MLSALVPSPEISQLDRKVPLLLQFVLPTHQCHLLQVNVQHPSGIVLLPVLAPQVSSTLLLEHEHTQSNLSQVPLPLNQRRYFRSDEPLQLEGSFPQLAKRFPCQVHLGTSLNFYCSSVLLPHHIDRVNAS